MYLHSLDANGFFHCNTGWRLVDGFEGKLTTSKWARRAKCFQDTADLIVKSILVKERAGGRSTGYRLTQEEQAAPKYIPSGYYLGRQSVCRAAIGSDNF
ncbi:hypothetical protein [Hymenobacter busanensis]|uniref:hypothetical protein n=1 Tax=Hymenobacter busanensis TaxID=2607656 RepID=UPI00191C1548|nr:hypothetical protein [Hymenobacter busanensis]